LISAIDSSTHFLLTPLGSGSSDYMLNPAAATAAFRRAKPGNDIIVIRYTRPLAMIVPPQRPG